MTRAPVDPARSTTEYPAWNKYSLTLTGLTTRPAYHPLPTVNSLYHYPVSFRPPIAPTCGVLVFSESHNFPPSSRCCHIAPRSSWSRHRAIPALSLAHLLDKRHIWDLQRDFHLKLDTAYPSKQWNASLSHDSTHTPVPLNIERFIGCD